MKNEIDKIEKGARRKSVLDAISRCYHWCKSSGRGMDAESLIEWDRTINHSRLLDYSRDRNYRMGLILQARVLITVYTRERLGGVGDQPGVQLPTMFKTLAGYKREEDLSDSERATQIETYMDWLRNKIVRIRVFASKWRVRKATLDSLDQAEREYRQYRRQRLGQSKARPKARQANEHREN